MGLVSRILATTEIVGLRSIKANNTSIEILPRELISSFNGEKT